MPTRALTQTWIYNGRFYGPGVAVELPDDAAAAIDGKMGKAPVRDPPAAGLINPDDLARLQGANVPPGDLAAALAQPGTIVHGTVEDGGAPLELGVALGGFEELPGAVELPPDEGAHRTEPSLYSVVMSLGLPSLTVDRLINAGYGSDEAIRAATDKDLLAIDGIGPATVRALRQAYGSAV